MSRHIPIDIPPAGTTLTFNYGIGTPAVDCPDPQDGLRLLIDGTQVWSSTDDGPCVNVPLYQVVSIDLAALGVNDGFAHALRFEGVSSISPPDNNDLTNVFLDQVRILVPPDNPEPPVPSDCTCTGCNVTQGGDDDNDAVCGLDDNCTLAPNPDQLDTDGDGYGNACDADFNQDCIVNVVDLGILRTLFFLPDNVGDLNADGTTNVIDLGILRTLFFQAPGPSPADPCVP